MADSSYACPELLWAMIRLANPTMMVVRFRMDVALLAPAPERKLVPIGGVNPAKARDYQAAGAFDPITAAARAAVAGLSPK